MPVDALISADSTLTNDPSALCGRLENNPDRAPGKVTGALRAFGEHKESGIAFMCEILAGCFTGGGTSGPIPGGQRERVTNGMLSIYLKPSAVGAESVAQSARDYAEYVKAARPAVPGGEVLLPGEPEARARKARLRDGITLPPDVWAAITRTADGLGVKIG